jgi:hypothetical protein
MNPMKRASMLIALFALLLPLSLQAQTTFVYVPDNQPGVGSTNVIPFGTGSSTTWKNQRYQQLIPASYLPTKASLLRSLAFAPTVTGTYQCRAMVVRIGHNTSSTLAGDFVGSFSIPPTTLVNQANYSWQISAGVWSPMPFTCTRPFVYNGKDNLVIEVIALGSDLNSSMGGFKTGTEVRSYDFGWSFATAPYSTTYGTGCQGSNSKVPVFAGYGFPLLGADCYGIGLADAIGSTSAICTIGFSKTSLAGIPLPFGLGFLGATGCSLYGDINLTLPATTDTAGKAMVNLALPADPVLEGAPLYNQWLIVDGQANPFGLVLTGGLENTLTQVSRTSKSTTSAAAQKVRLGFL